MGYGSDDVYYNPDKFGLEVVGSADIADSYEFDMFLVLTDGKQLFWARDSGCSCPSPFEDYTSLDMLESGSVDSCLRAIENWSDSSYYSNRAGLAGLREAVRDWKATA